VQDHQVTSICGRRPIASPTSTPNTRVFFDGLTASFFLGDCIHCGIYQATATCRPW
jgi:hypothetical protein